MPDIVIRHCTLHIVRRGVGAGDRTPGAGAQGGSRLGSLLERQFAEMWPDGADIDVVAPVRLAIALRFTELVEATKTDTTAHWSPLYERLRTAVEQAVEQAIKDFRHRMPPSPPLRIAVFRLDEAPRALREVIEVSCDVVARGRPRAALARCGRSHGGGLARDAPFERAKSHAT